MADWPGLTLKDAMPLRLAGGLHHLLLSGADTRLTGVYDGTLSDQRRIDELVCDLVETFDERLLPWLDGPPQTNEAGRSASIMAAQIGRAHVELQSLMRISYAVFCLKKKNTRTHHTSTIKHH